MASTSPNTTIETETEPEIERTPFDEAAEQTARRPSAAEAERIEERRKAARAGAVKRVKRGRATKVLLGLAVVFIGATAVARRMSEKEQQWRREPIEMPDRLARVSEKMDPPALADLLAKRERLRHPGTFLEEARAIGLKDVLPGGYELPQKAGPADLARIFKAGPTMQKVTFPEGFTCRQIVERLAARKFAAAPEMMKLAYPVGAATSPAEGRWFPSTYWLNSRGTAKDLSARLADGFKGIIDQLPTTYPTVRGKRMTQREVVTLASIVERETSVERERAIVAGVLINRLNKGMRLECDATIQYARERAEAGGALAQGQKAKLSYRDIDAVRESPFNTYRRKGLPPAPICNPGRAALEAAIRPKSHKYLFYVLSPFKRAHRFSVSYEQFLLDKALLKKERKALGQ